MLGIGDKIHLIRFEISKGIAYIDDYYYHNIIDITDEEEFVVEIQDRKYYFNEDKLYKTSGGKAGYGMSLKNYSIGNYTNVRMCDLDAEMYLRDYAAKYNQMVRMFEEMTEDSYSRPLTLDKVEMITKLLKVVED